MIVKIVNVYHIFLVRSREDGGGKAFIFEQRSDPGTDNHIRAWNPL